MTSSLVQRNIDMNSGEQGPVRPSEHVLRPAILQPPQAQSCENISKTFGHSASKSCKIKENTKHKIPEWNSSLLSENLPHTRSSVQLSAGLHTSEATSRPLFFPGVLTQFSKHSFLFSFHRASYYEISVDDGPWEKQKSSGLNLCTGTGSKAWSFNINRVAAQAVEDVLNIARRQGNLTLPLNKELVEKVTNEYNESLLYSPEEPKILFSIREPIANRVFSSSRQRCFSSKVCVRSRCWDACMVVDGGTSFEFNDGAIASMMINKEDELRTVILEQ
ncbi:UPF0465 protein C5orf33-like [Cricetulus griseus]|uniref:UPF0465 protein C5orf33-like n=1 Tax=Cricetulus griseus TaxID=10029 RepID=G3HJU7_CRIGR|nr:UPF0465 protein C5orf33-like [Cricetulus griseus]